MSWGVAAGEFQSFASPCVKLEFASSLTRPLFFSRENMILFAAFALFAFAFVPAGVLYQRLGALRDRRIFTREGRWIAVGDGRRLYALERGVDGLTVVFESGIAATSLNWSRVQQEVSRGAGTLSYDRAGLGWSSASLNAPTPSNVASELHAMLQAAQIKPPYVLVGHSFGGFVMRRFALTYPEEVASMVLIDPMRCEEWPPINAAKQAVVDRGARLARYAIPIAQLGVARLAVTSLLCGSGRTTRWLEGFGGDGTQHVMGRIRQEIGKIPRATWPALAAHWSRPAFYAGVCAHLQSIPDTVREMSAAAPVRGVPVLVLTPDSTTPLTDEQLRAIGDQARQVIVPDSAHWVHLDQPEMVIEAIREAVEAARIAQAGAQTMSEAT
jgi:pimeloyl-ACP methyl ester carboxylesterase